MSAPSTPAESSVQTDNEPLLTDLLGEEIVSVIVGVAAKRYQIHKNLLCHHSRFFDAALNGNFKEGESGELRLPEEDASAFDIFVHWLYSGDLAHNVHWHLRYLHVYIMGEKWFIPRLQDLVFNRLWHLWYLDKFPPCFFFEQLYEVTSPGCKLRQYFVKKLVFHALHKQNLGTVKKALERSGDLAIDVAKEMCLKLSIVTEADFGYPRPEILDQCDFHVHGRGPICKLYSN